MVLIHAIRGFDCAGNHRGISGQQRMSPEARRHVGSHVSQRPGRAHVEIDSNRLLMYVPEGTDTDARVKLMQDWQRKQLRLAVAPVITKWEQIIDRRVPGWSIRRMKTKWGSCNRQTGHIWFNLELAKKHPLCLEYIVVHEMTHLLERHHGERYTKLMDTYMPDWRARRDQLNAAPLAAEDWGSQSGGGMHTE
jgi:predicted metal-dependent hydrolase